MTSSYEVSHPSLVPGVVTRQDLRFSFGFGTAMYGKLGQTVVVQVPQSNVMMLLTSSHKATNFDAAKTDWKWFFP